MKKGIMKASILLLVVCFAVVKGQANINVYQTDRIISICCPLAEVQKNPNWFVKDEQRIIQTLGLKLATSLEREMTIKAKKSGNAVIKTKTMATSGLQFLMEYENPLYPAQSGASPVRQKCRLYISVDPVAYVTSSGEIKEAEATGEEKEVTEGLEQGGGD